MKLKVTFDGQDVSKYIDTKSYQIETNLGGQLDNFNNAKLTGKLTSDGVNPLLAYTVETMQWKRLIIEDTDLPLPMIDTFNRANNYLINSNTPDAGPAWTIVEENPSSDIVVTNSSPYFGALVISNNSYVEQNTGSANCEINLSFLLGDCPFVEFRYNFGVADDSGYFLYNLGGTTYLANLVSGSLNTLLSASGAAPGDVFKIGLNSADITIWRNGTQIFNYQDSYWVDATYVSFGAGLFGYTTGHVYGPFSVTYPTASTSRRIFSGYCDHAERVMINGIEAAYRISCKDDMVLLGKKLTYNTYVNKTDKYIIQDLLTTYFGALFNLTTAINSTATMPYFASHYETVLEAIRRICEINGTRFWIDYDGVVHYTNSTSGTLAPFNFSETGHSDLTSATRSMLLSSYSHDLSALSTKVVLIGPVEQRSFAAENFTSGPHNLQTLTPTVSQFKYAGYNYPVFWTYDNGGNSSIVDGLAVDSTSTGYANRFHVLYKDAGGSTYGTTINMQAGEMVLCSETLTGFESQKCTFEEGYIYVLNVDVTGRVIIGRGGTTFAGAGNCTVQVIPIVGVPGDSFFNTPRAIWLGHGWPCVVNTATGVVRYTTASYYDTMTSAGATTVPTPPPIIPDGTYPHSISYSGPVPIKEVATINVLRDVYGPIYNGTDHMYFELVIKDEKIKDETTARDRALKALVERALGITSVEITSMWAAGLQPGMIVNVNSPSMIGSAANYVVNKVTIKGMGGDAAMYDITMGDYNPELQDFYLKLRRQKDDSQEGEDERTTVTVTQDYLTTTTYYYDDTASVWDDFTLG